MDELSIIQTGYGIGVPGVFSTEQALQQRRFAALLLVVEVIVLNRLEGFAAMDHLIDYSPVGQTAEVMVVDEDVRVEFAGDTHIGCFLGEGSIDGIELQSAFAAIVHGILEQLSLAACIEDDLAHVFALEFLERLDGKRNRFAYLRVCVGNDCSVKIYGDSHSIYDLDIYDLRLRSTKLSRCC